MAARLVGVATRHRGEQGLAPEVVELDGLALPEDHREPGDQLDGRPPVLGERGADRGRDPTGQRRQGEVAPALVGDGLEDLLPEVLAGGVGRCDGAQLGEHRPPLAALDLGHGDPAQLREPLELRLVEQELTLVDDDHLAGGDQTGTDGQVGATGGEQVHVRGQDLDERLDEASTIVTEEVVIVDHHTDPGRGETPPVVGEARRELARILGRERLEVPPVGEQPGEGHRAGGRRRDREEPLLTERAISFERLSQQGGLAEAGTRHDGRDTTVPPPGDPLVRAGTIEHRSRAPRHVVQDDHAGGA